MRRSDCDFVIAGLKKAEEEVSDLRCWVQVMTLSPKEIEAVREQLNKV